MVEKYYTDDLSRLSVESDAYLQEQKDSNENAIKILKEELRKAQNALDIINAELEKRKA